MPPIPAGATAVIFVSQRTAHDEAGYDAAAKAMETLAREQPGYIGFRAVRGVDGIGIATSYWADDAAAGHWRDHPAHSLVRDLGRTRWYAWSEVIVAKVERSYSSAGLAK